MIQFDEHIFQMGWNHQPEQLVSENGWLEDDPFLLGFGNFSGAMWNFGVGSVIWILKWDPFGADSENANVSILYAPWDGNIYPAISPSKSSPFFTDLM